MDKKYKKLVEILNKNNLTKVVYEDEGKKYLVERSSVAIASQSVAQSNNVSTDQKPIFDGTQIKAPIVGTFYEAKGPGKKAFVKKGDSVKKGQVLFIIEAMKVMNEVKSTCNGVVKEILFKDGELVEFDQPVMIVG